MRKVLSFQRNAFQGYSTGQEHDCSIQHRSRRTEAGRSQQESLGLDSAPAPSCQDTGGGDIERVRKGGSRGGLGRESNGMSPWHQPTCLLSPGPAAAADSSCPSWPLARKLAPLLTPEPDRRGSRHPLWGRLHPVSRRLTGRPFVLLLSLKEADLQGDV